MIAKKIIIITWKIYRKTPPPAKAFKRVFMFFNLYVYLFLMIVNVCKPLVKELLD